MWLALLVSSLVPSRAADAPEYLLGNLDVRIDLPSGWKMTRWSDDDFAGQTTDGSVLVFAWSAPIQTPVTDAAPWADAFTSKVSEMSGKSPALSKTSMQEIGGRKVAFVDVGFQFGSGGHGTMYGAVVEIPGRDLLLATISPDRLARAGERARRDLVSRLDYRGHPAPESTYGATVKASGVETKLPPDFRPALDDEWSSISGVLEKLGREDYTPCWIAVRPHPLEAPDVLAACPATLSLGVVDEYSFADAETEVRAKLFGKSLDPGSLVQLSDRVGFLYTPRDGIAMGAVPDASGVAVFWGLGGGGMGDAVKAAMSGTTWDGPHPVETADVVSYWLTERTFSPQVLCPSLCCLGAGLGVAALGVGLVVVRSRRRGGGEEDA